MQLHLTWNKIRYQKPMEVRHTLMLMQILNVFWPTYGFSRQQGSVYFGDVEKVDAVKCVLAVQDLTRKFPWFAASVEDIRMLRIEDNNDLMPAIEMITG